jgi:hypothetical protein
LIGRESGKLVVERPDEGRPCFAALHVSSESVKISELPAAICDPQHRDHHQVADGEAVAFEPWLVAQPIRELLQPQPSEMLKRGLGRLRPLLIGENDIEECAKLDERLDAADRRKDPLNCAELCLRIARQEHIGFLANILENRTAFEDLDGFVAEARHLIERLIPGISGRPVAPDQLDSIIESRLFERPPHSKVLHESLGARRHPAKSRNLDRRVGIERHRSLLAVDCYAAAWSSTG